MRERGTVLHGNDPSSASKFFVAFRGVQVVGVVSLAVVDGVSLLGELDFDFAELPIEILVSGIVGERVVVGSLLGRGRDGIANSVAVEKSFASGRVGKLQESVAF